MKELMFNYIELAKVVSEEAPIKPTKLKGLNRLTRPISHGDIFFTLGESRNEDILGIYLSSRKAKPFLKNPEEGDPKNDADDELSGSLEFGFGYDGNVFSRILIILIKVGDKSSPIIKISLPDCDENNLGDVFNPIKLVKYLKPKQSQLDKVLGTKFQLEDLVPPLSILQKIKSPLKEALGEIRDKLKD